MNVNKPLILLHACCATCSAYCLAKLSASFQPVIYYDNPNIHPAGEYAKRRDELKAYAHKLRIDFLERTYQPEQWQRKMKGLEQEPEKGKRCRLCFEDRLARTAQFALKSQIPYFTTTLTISPHKDSQTILTIGKTLEKVPELIFLSENFKKRNGFFQTTIIAKEQNFYRQNYCGCTYSQPSIP